MFTAIFRNAVILLLLTVSLGCDQAGSSDLLVPLEGALGLGPASSLTAPSVPVPDCGTFTAADASTVGPHANLTYALSSPVGIPYTVGCKREFADLTNGGSLVQSVQMAYVPAGQPGAGHVQTIHHIQGSQAGTTTTLSYHLGGALSGLTITCANGEGTSVGTAVYEAGRLAHFSLATPANCISIGAPAQTVQFLYQYTGTSPIASRVELRNGSGALVSALDLFSQLSPAGQLLRGSTIVTPAGGSSQTLLAPDYFYNAAGLMTSWDFSNSAGSQTATLTYDGSGRSLVTYQATDSTGVWVHAPVVQSPMTFTYSANGNIDRVDLGSSEWTFY